MPLPGSRAVAAVWVPLSAAACAYLVLKLRRLTEQIATERRLRYEERRGRETNPRALCSSSFLSCFQGGCGVCARDRARARLSVCLSLSLCLSVLFLIYFWGKYRHSGRDFAAQPEEARPELGV